MGNGAFRFRRERTPARTLRPHRLGYLLSRGPTGRTPRQGNRHVWFGNRTARPSPGHGRADEVPDAGRLDGHGGNRTVRADLSPARSGHRAVSRAGNRGHGGTFREWARLHVASPSSGQATLKNLALAPILLAPRSRVVSHGILA